LDCIALQEQGSWRVRVLGASAGGSGPEDMADMLNALLAYDGMYAMEVNDTDRQTAVLVDCFPPVWCMIMMQLFSSFACSDTQCSYDPTQLHQLALASRSCCM
jgi:hypothetical protein